MNRPGGKSDRRLLGSWKSDRRATFRHFVPKPGANPDAVRQLRSLFGKLVVRWGRGKLYSNLDGFQEVEDYEVVARDSQSVVIRMFDKLAREDRLTQIHFEGEYSWVWALGMREYFRRVVEQG